MPLLANSDDTRVLCGFGLDAGKTCTPDEEDCEEVPMFVLEKSLSYSLHPVENKLIPMANQSHVISLKFYYFQNPSLGRLYSQKILKISQISASIFL